MASQILLKDYGIVKLNSEKFNRRDPALEGSITFNFNSEWSFNDEDSPVDNFKVNLVATIKGVQGDPTENEHFVFEAEGKIVGEFQVIGNPIKKITAEKRKYVGDNQLIILLIDNLNNLLLKMGISQIPFPLPVESATKETTVQDKE